MPLGDGRCHCREVANGPAGARVPEQLGGCRHDAGSRVSETLLRLVGDSGAARTVRATTADEVVGLGAIRGAWGAAARTAMGHRRHRRGARGGGGGGGITWVGTHKNTRQRPN